MTEYDDSLKFLYGRIDYERSQPPPGPTGFQLDRIRELLRRLGDPQDGQRIVHITGTKGKGSTAALIAGVLTAAGYRTGQFTSPHLQRIEERLAIDGVPCPTDRFNELVDEVRGPVADMDRLARAAGDEGGGPTFFEIITAVALLHFARHPCDATVLEVGLGGRLDSTNICRPQVSVITTISFDHMKQLGNTLAAIAREKAGIVKPGVPVVTGVLEAEPREVIAEVARSVGAPLRQLGRDFDYLYHAPRPLAIGGDDVEGASVTSPNNPLAAIDFRQGRGENELLLGDWRLDDVSLAMPGKHQGLNAAVALAAIRELLDLGWSIPEAAIRAGMSGTACPARVEIVRRRPTVVLDAAHNPASIDALVQTLGEILPGRPLVVVFACSRDKDAAGILRRLLPAVRHLVMTKFESNPRATPPDELATIAVDLLNGEEFANRPRPTWEVAGAPPEAWGRANARRESGDVLCVTGSFFLAAELRSAAEQIRE